MRVACIGEAMIEVSMAGTHAQVGVAGDTLNTAVYLKRTAPNMTVDYITRLGADPFSDQIAQFIGANGIGCSNITRDAGKSPGLYAITTSDSGERSFTYWRDTSAARDLFGDRDFSMLVEYDAIYISAISMAILPQEIRLALAEYLAHADARLIYDSNYRPRLWENVETARQITGRMWEIADILLPSLDDEMALFDETADTVQARFAQSSGIGALKRGALGPMSIGSDVTQSYPPATTVIDTTAAGDRFNGAYVATLLSGASQADALMAGHMCARYVVGKRGALVSDSVSG